MTAVAQDSKNIIAEERPVGRCLILANPRARTLAMWEYFAGLASKEIGLPGRGRPEARPAFPASLATLAQAAAAVGLQANVEIVPPPERLPDLLRAAQKEGFDTVVAVGGDGTVRTLAQSLVGSPLRLGILPLGTSNNFAHTLGIPFTLQGAMRALAEGVERRVDVGRIGPEYFLEAAGVGLFADTLLACGREELQRHQALRMLRIAGPICWNPVARRLQLTLDGVVEKEEAVMVAVANDTYLGDGWPVAPDAGLSDGLFDVVIVGALSRWELLRFGAALLRGQHLELPKVRHVRARRVEIRRAHRVHRPLPVHADDHIAAYTPVVMEAVPAALRVIAPPLSTE